MGLETGRQARTPRTHSQWVVGPGRTPEQTRGRGWESARPRTSHTQARGASHGHPHAAPTAHKGARFGVGDGSPARTPRTHSQWVVGPGRTPERTRGRGWESARPRTPHTQAGGAPPPAPSSRSTARKSARCGVGDGSPGPRPPHPQPVGSGAHTNTRAHSTGPASPGSPPRGRAAGGGGAPDPRRPSQRRTASPPGDALPPSPRRAPLRAGVALAGRRATPARKGARRGAGAGSPHPHPPHSGHTGRRTLTARSRGRATGGGTGLTPDAPHNGGRPPPPGTAPHHPHGTQPPQGMQAKGTVLGPHTHTPAPTTRGWRTLTACPVGRQSGEGQRLTSDAPHNGARYPPWVRPSTTPTASNAGPQGRTLWGRCWVPTPVPTAPGTHGSRNPG